MLGRVLSLFFLFYSISCATLNEKELFMRMEQFNLFMRWKRFADASAFVLEEKREEFISHYSELADRLYFTDISVLSVDVKEKEKTASARVLKTYYIYPDIVEKKVLLEEKWVWSEKGWFLSEGFLLK